MNSVQLIGRLTRDPQVSYGAASQTAVCRFTVAIDRAKGRDGEDRGADFISVVCFGKTAELCERYISKGRLVGISGRIQTGSYEKNGQKIYTTDVVADRVEFLDRGDRSESGSSGGNSYGGASSESTSASSAFDDIPGGFSKLTEDDIPF